MRESTENEEKHRFLLNVGKITLVTPRLHRNRILREISVQKNII